MATSCSRPRRSPTAPPSSAARPSTTRCCARSQAEAYARALPAAEGRPPLLLVVDVGHVIEVYAEFSRSGATYTPFPDARSHRITLAALCEPGDAGDKLRARLRAAWLDPLSLDPSRASARVTRQVSALRADLARSLEGAGHAPQSVAAFLSRCLFCMFAEDVELLPRDATGQGAFIGLLTQWTDGEDRSGFNRLGLLLMELRDRLPST